LDFFKVNYHRDLFSSSRQGLLNLPETRRMTQGWQSVGLALIGQAGIEERPIFSFIYSLFLTILPVAKILCHGLMAQWAMRKL
jgi:hypothetical protein